MPRRSAAQAEKDEAAAIAETMEQGAAHMAGRGGPLEPTEPEEVEGEVRELDPTEEVDEDQQAVTAVVPSPAPRAVALTNKDRQLVYTMIVGQIADVTVDEYEFFLRVSELRGLNPLFRESHLIKDGTGRINIQVGIDGFRKLAEQTGQYKGQGPATYDGEYTGPIHEWTGKPAHCTVAVYRAGFEEPMIGESWLDEDGQLTRDGVPSGQWLARPRTMLAKVAEARAIRRAFPRSVAGLYTDDEIAQGAVAMLPPGSAPEIRPLPSGDAESAQSGTDGVWHPPAVPDAPEGAVSAVVESLEELRQSKIKWINDEVHLKIEVKTKIKGRKHTVIAIDDLATAIDAAALQPAEVIAIAGATYTEVAWGKPEEKKPPMKQYRLPTELYVLRSNEWIPVSTIPRAQETMPLADPPNRGASSSASPSSPSSSPSESSPASTATSSPATSSSTPSGGSSSRSASSEPRSEPSPPPPASDSADSSSGPSDPDEPPEIPTKEAPPPPPPPREFTAGPEGETLDRVFELIAPIQMRQREGKPKGYAYMELADQDTGELFRGIMDEDEAIAQLRVNRDPAGEWMYVVRDRLRVIGTYRSTWIILTAVTIVAQ